MKKAVITTGSKQYLVHEGMELDVELLDHDKKAKFDFEPLLVIDEDKANIGQPTVKGAKVTASHVEDVKGEKVIAIRYKAKKRVNKKRGHRQNYSRIKIDKIT